MSDGSGTGEELGLLPFEDGSTGRLIRRQWHNSAWYFSVIDVIAVLTDSERPRKYWADLKARMQYEEGFKELSAKIGQLKMLSTDGKRYKTDAATAETLLRIVQSVPSPKAEPVKQWLAREGARRLEEVAVNDEQKRLLLRGDMTDRNRTLADAASAVGVTSRDFGIFQDFGYKGLYGGETAKDIAARKGLSKGEHILDWMGPEELADNIFRAAQTEAKLKRDPIQTKADANRAHFEMGKAIRGFIAEQGGTMPEDLSTPEQSIQQLERAEQERVKARRQPSLFPPDADHTTGEDE